MLSYEIKDKKLEKKFSRVLKAAFDSDFEQAMTHFLTLPGTSPRKPRADRIYQQLRKKILVKQPELAGRDRQTILQEFDRLSQKAAANLPYATVDEFMQVMRRETLR